jgi:hypothetical protein
LIFEVMSQRCCTVVAGNPLSEVVKVVASVGGRTRADCPAMKTANAAARNRGPGRPFPPGVSGNPAGRPLLHARARKLFATMLSDFGSLGPTDRILLERASFLLARSERLRDADVSMRMSGEARRIIASLRKNAPARAVQAERFTEIAVKAQAEEEARRVAELAADAGEGTPSGDGEAV